MPSSVATTRGTWWKEARWDIAAAVLATVGGLLVAIWTLKLWRMHPHIPLGYGGDGTYTAALLKTIDRHLSYFSTNRLGFPFGQSTQDFPLPADGLNVAFAKAIGLFTDSPGLIINTFFILGYPLTALTGYLGSRLLGLRRSISVVIGVIYTALPFHDFRFVHLFLANYAVLPLAAALVIRQAGPRPLLRTRPGARLFGLGHRGAVIGLTIVVITSLTGIYYAGFTCLFLLTAAGLAWLRGNRSSAYLAVGAIAVIGALIVVQLVPSILYQRAHGDNPVAARTTADLEYYPLRPSVMLLPVVGHRLEPLRDWRDRLQTPIISSEGPGEALGAFGAIGFVLCLGLAFSTIARRRRPRWSRRVADAPVFLVVGLLFAIYSGVEVILGSFGFTQLRAWTRISVFLAFFCIATLGALLSHAVRNRRRVGLGILAIVAVVAVWDQSSVFAVPNYAATATVWAQEQTFYDQIETTLGSGAAVFQLPMANFPESPAIVNMSDYSQLAGYLHTDNLKWSYGGVKGRSADWRLRLDPSKPGFVDDLLITGFTGLDVNLNGYADGGAAIDVAMRTQGISPTIDSQNGDVRFYDLRPARSALEAAMTPAQQQARKSVLLTQPDVRFGAGTYDAEDYGATPTRWLEPTSKIRLQGPVPKTGPAVIRLTLRSFSPGPSTLTVAVQGTTQTFTMTDAFSNVDVRADVDGKPIDLTLTSNAPSDGAVDPRNLVLSLYSLPTVLPTGSP